MIERCNAPTLPDLIGDTDDIVWKIFPFLGEAFDCQRFNPLISSPAAIN